MSKSFTKGLAFVLALTVVMMTGVMGAFAETPATIEISSIESGDRVNAIQLVKPDGNKENGWTFTAAWIAEIFCENYGISPSGTGSTYTDADWAAAIDELLKDYEGAVGGNAVNGAAIAGSRNASTKFRETLQDIVDHIGTTYTDYNDTAVSSGTSVTLQIAASNEDITKAGLYLVSLVAKAGSHNVYDNMAAYINFGYYNGGSTPAPGYNPTNGLPDRIVSFRVAAKKSVDAMKKELTNGAFTSIQLANPNASYKITCTYPSFASEYAATAIYTIQDTSEHLRNYKDVVVKIDGTTKTAGTDYTITFDTSDYSGSVPQAYNKGFTITFLDGAGALPDYNSANAGKTVTIEYTACVTNLDTATGEIINEATSTTKTSATDEDPWITKSRVQLDTYKIKIRKTDVSGTPLQGARFICNYNSAGNPNSSGNPSRSFVLVDGVYYHMHDDYYNANSGAGRDYGYIGVLFKEAGGNITPTRELVTDENGEITVAALDAGDGYWFKEVGAPAGYTLNDTWLFCPAVSQLGLNSPTSQTTIYDEDGAPIYITEYDLGTVGINNGSSSDAKQNFTQGNDSATATVICVDTVVFALPSTGALGAYIFSFLGTACMSAAVILFVRDNDKLRGKLGAFIHDTAAGV